MGKSGPNAAFNLIFPGLGWPWVGEFVGFIVIFICFPTQQNLVYRKHPNGEFSGENYVHGLAVGYEERVLIDLMQHFTTTGERWMAARSIPQPSRAAWHMRKGRENGGITWQKVGQGSGEGQSSEKPARTSPCAHAYIRAQLQSASCSRVEGNTFVPSVDECCLQYLRIPNY